ncbi:MAG: peptidoglycan-associated lipoprotein Pal [Endomicrobium sp.]|jgi:peptidoglycan-associated lipoprotein|nr:peptidoglycan-associated lipoprotein Pal [Endomicrobium sp.]
MKKFLLPVLAAAFIFTAGCKKQDIKHDNVDSTDSVETVVFSDEPSIRGNYSDRDINLNIIYFDFDKNDLIKDSMEILKENADYLKSNPDIKVVLEGHTDERGTTEYNLSLGQRRALKVKEYYTQLGVAANRIATISYGREKPVDFRKNELGWANNRRVETKLLVRQK